MFKRSIPVLLVSLLSLVGATPAMAEAETPAPVWNVRAIVAPTNLPPGGEGVVIVTATNLGDLPASLSAADPLRVSVQLPEGLKQTEAVTATSIASDSEASVHESFYRQLLTTCALASKFSGACEERGDRVLLYEPVEIVIHVRLAKRAHTVPLEISVSGGGAAPVSVSDPLTVSSAPVTFGVEPGSFAMQPFNADGSLDTQAGSHPFQYTTTFMYNQAAAQANTFADDPRGGKEEEVEELVDEPLVFPKELTFDPPPGLIGDPDAVPRCPLNEFETNEGCPPDTQVGVSTVFLSGFGVPGLEGRFGNEFAVTVPVYNLEPSVGEPARFGFHVNSDVKVAVYLDTGVRTGSDYGVVVTVHNISQAVTFVGSQLSLWGDPGDPRHDNARGTCVISQVFRGEFYEDIGFTKEEGTCEHTQAGSKQPPFLSLPASCSGLSDPFTASMEATSWVEPNPEHTPGAEYRLHEDGGEPLGMTGCNKLPFDPSIALAPDSQAGSTPTGLTVGVHVDQTAALNPTGLTEADVKDTTVALPQGVQLSPSASDGLQACSLAQIGFTDSNPVTGEDEFTPNAPTCPDASKVATVKISTPLLPNPLEGAVYLASPQNFAGPLENPFSALVAMYIVAEDPVSGVLVKLPGKVSLTESGQIVSTFEDTPQLPFENLELHFFGGARAPLATPALCGSYTTQASFTPSTENPPTESASSFDIESGPNGAPCADPLPFDPTLSSETTNIQAGAFTPLSTTLSREDGQQSIQSVTLHYPAGLSGLLSGVKLCGETEANAGTCGPESEIGETIVSVGLGNDPFTVTGGKVYITGPYEGAPFGLSIVNPAKAGPFDLQEGRPVVVRAKVEVNPTTAALTITTDPPGSLYAIPDIIEGIPLDIKHVNVNVNRPGFTFNPTSCNPTQITGVVNSAEGASSPVSVPFQVTNCAALKFTPKFTVSTSGKTSKADGASLTTKVEEPAGSMGTQADIAKVKVELPLQLPSRLTTLQKACTDAQFEANPAACPSASFIGHAVVHTPLVPVPLEGPAIFVSHGGEAFPSLEIVLQGYGVKVVLVGATFISKSGITSTTFKTVPDQPFNTFELTLPEGPYSALAANGNLCQQKLVMPTAFVAQNGATLNQNTNIKVEGCSNTISLISTHLTKNTLKLSVAVPSSGKLTADGVGLSKATKSANGRETITVTLKVKPTKAQAALLAHHHGRKLVDHVKLTFRLANGKKLTKTFSVMV
jgi:hypothetical protein